MDKAKARLLVRDETAAILNAIPYRSSLQVAIACGSAGSIKSVSSNHRSFVTFLRHRKALLIKANKSDVKLASTSKDMQSMILSRNMLLRAPKAPVLSIKSPIHHMMRFSTQTSGVQKFHHANFRTLNFRPLVANIRKYSTNSTPPPPPPPPADKNAKGKVFLNRITRAFTFSLSSAIVVGAAGVAVLVVYLILSELFLPSGDTRTFNKAVKLVEKSEVAQKLLDFEKGERLRAYGGGPGDKWVRNRPVHGIRTKGQDGKDHLLMQFHVESDSGKHASVTLEQVDTSYWSSEFAYIALDVPGKKRAYVVEPKFQSKGYVPKMNGAGGFLGLKWGPKKDE